MKIDLVYYGDQSNDKAIELTIKYAKVYCEVVNHLISNEASEINDFIYQSQADYILFLGGPAKCVSGICEALDYWIERDANKYIITFNVSDLELNYFEPIEPSYSYRHYAASLASCRSKLYEPIESRHTSDWILPSANHIFCISRLRFKELTGIDERIRQHINLYLSWKNLYLDGKVITDTSVCIGIKEPKLLVGSYEADFLGQLFITNYAEIQESSSGRKASHGGLAGSRELTDKKFYRLRELDLYKLRQISKGRCLIVNSVGLLERFPHFGGDIISSNREILAKYYINYLPHHSNSQSRIELNVALLQQGLDDIKYGKVDYLIANSDSGPRDGFVFAPPFANYDDEFILCLQLAGFLGYEEIEIFEEKYNSKLDNFLNILVETGVRVKRHIIW